MATCRRETKPKATRNAWRRRRECWVPNVCATELIFIACPRNTVSFFLSARTTNMFFSIQLWTFIRQRPTHIMLHWNVYQSNARKFLSFILSLAPFFFFIRYIRWADYARSELWEGVRSLWLGWRIVDESLTFATIFIQWIHLISAAHFSELSFSGSSSRIKHAFKHGFNPIDFSGLPYIYSSWIINEANSELVLNWLLQQWKPSQLVIFTMSNKNTLHSVDFIIVMAWNVSRCGMHCLAFHA